MTGHYSTNGGPSPISVITEAGLCFASGNVIKYVYRFPRKGGSGRPQEGGLLSSHSFRA